MKKRVCGHLRTSRQAGRFATLAPFGGGIGRRGAHTCAAVCREYFCLFYCLEESPCSIRPGKLEERWNIWYARSLDLLHFVIFAASFLSSCSRDFVCVRARIGILLLACLRCQVCSVYFLVQYTYHIWDM